MTIIAVIILLLTFTICIKLSKRLLGSMFAPLGVVAVVWCSSLLLFFLGFVEYPPMRAYTWWVLLLSLLAFFVGTGTAGLAHTRHSRGIALGHSARVWESHVRMNQERVRRIIVVFSIIATCAVLLQWASIISEFGGIRAVFIAGNRFRYAFLIRELDFPLTSYIWPCALAVAPLAGLYLACGLVKDKVMYLPILPIVGWTLGIMGRQGILFGLLLYTNGFLLGRLLVAKKPVTRKILATSLVIASLVAAVWGWILDLRVADVGPYMLGQPSPLVERARDVLPRAVYNSILTNYIYLTDPLARLNDSVQFFEPTESSLGLLTFASLGRLLAKIGLVNPSFAQDYLQELSLIHPNLDQPSTVLRELYSDFGLVGMLGFLWFLGIISAHLFLKLFHQPSFGLLLTVVFLFLFLEYSLFYSIFVETAIGIAFPVAIFTGLLLDRPRPVSKRVMNFALPTPARIKAKSFSDSRNTDFVDEAG